jgi:glycosyltransferase involved in cell wall biosynthesis
VPPGDPAALAAAMKWAAADPGALRAMGERGRRFVEQHYSREAQGARFVTILEEAAADRGTR